MPEHTSWFSYLLEWLVGHTALEQNMHVFGSSLFGKPVGAHQAEPLTASLFVVLMLVALAAVVGPKLRDYKNSVIPDEKLTLRTFFEVFIGYFYDTMKSMMGPKRAKRYFPLIGTSACFIFFANFLGAIPGFLPPTASWNITWGCSLVVFVMFNYYGLRENGFAYLKHLAGPWLGWYYIPINLLVLVIEIFATCLRAVTLSMRLMINLAVDHLVLGVFMGLVAIILPIPVMALGTIVAAVQTLVFCLLASIYVTLATDHDHEAEHGHGHDAAKKGHDLEVDHEDESDEAHA
ncbi:hypothetical protein BH09MYX1_BH09MYX1_16830 [soil metagenome]